MRFFELAEDGALEETLRVNLVSLLGVDEGIAIELPAAERLARLLDLYRRRTLSTDEKLARARRAPPWVPHLEAIESDWLSARLDSVVQTFSSDAAPDGMPRLIKVRGGRRTTCVLEVVRVVVELRRRSRRVEGQTVTGSAASGWSGAFGAARRA